MLPPPPSAGIAFPDRDATVILYESMSLESRTTLMGFGALPDL
jgi:hypothetical protein